MRPIRIPSLGHAPAGALPAMRERALAAAEAAGRAPGQIRLELRGSRILSTGELPVTCQPTHL
jgi:hypothetical protein